MTNEAVLGKAERALTRAIETVRHDGWTLEPGVTVDESAKRCCPWGAYVIANDGRDLHELHAELGMDRASLPSLMHGFDATKMDARTDLARGFYAMGARFRERYVGVRA